MRLYKNKVIFFLLILMTRVIFDFIFIKYIAQKWSYMGFYNEINVYKIIISYLSLFILTSILMWYKKEKLSHFFSYVLFVTVYLPMGTLYSLMNLSSEFFLMTNFVFFVLLISIFSLSNKYFGRNLTDDIAPNKGLIIILHLISLLTILVMTIQNIKNLNLSAVINLVNVYEIRELATYKWGMSYFFSWQTKVITPFMIVVLNSQNKHFLKWIYIGSQLWLYILTGHKIVIFTLILVILGLKFSKKFGQLFSFFSKSFFAINLVAIFELFITNKSYIVDFFIRRIIYIPALLNNYYYEFFSEAGFQYWRYTMFGRILDVTTDYSILPSYVIGREYFGNSQNNAVTGFLGSEYMNGGFLGLIIAALLVVFVLRSVDRLSYTLGNQVVLITMLTPIYTLWNTALLTSLLTGGVMISLLILFATEKNTTSKNMIKLKYNTRSKEIG